MMVSPGPNPVLVPTGRQRRAYSSPTWPAAQHHVRRHPDCAATRRSDMRMCGRMWDTRSLRILTFVFVGVVTCSIATAADTATRVYKIGFLGQTSAADLSRQIGALRQGLRELGYEEGRNVAFEYRWAERKLDRLPVLADEIVALKVDIIVTHGTLGWRAAEQATAII